MKSEIWAPFFKFLHKNDQRDYLPKKMYNSIIKRVSAIQTKMGTANEMDVFDNADHSTNIV